MLYFINKALKQTIVNEFNSHWVPNTSNLVSDYAKLSEWL